MQSGNTDFIYKNDLDKACFQHYMAYGKSKDLVKRTQSDKVLRDKAFKILLLVFCQELRYCLPYYQYAQLSSYDSKNIDIFSKASICK